MSNENTKLSCNFYNDNIANTSYGLYAYIFIFEYIIIMDIKLNKTATKDVLKYIS